MLKEFVFSVEPWGKEIAVSAHDLKQAQKIAWNSLPDQYKNNAECLDCVDEGSTCHTAAEVTSTQFRHAES